MKKIVLLVENSDEFLEEYTNLDEFNKVVNGEELHLLRVFEKSYYNDEFSEYSWPPEEKFPEIQEKVKNKLATFGKKIELTPKSTVVHCLIEDESYDSTVHFLKSIDADLVAVATRGLSGLPGLFTSSMTDHLIKFSPCPVFVFRPS